MTQSNHQQRISIVMMTIIWLFFFQLLTEFVEAIYLFGLLGSDIPPEIGMVLLFLSPLLLFLFRRPISPRWINALIMIALLARSVEIMLDTRGRMMISGIGVAALLMVFPAVLSQPRIIESRQRFVLYTGCALTLALFLSNFSRATNSGSDLFAYGMFKLITWGMALIAIVLIWRRPSHEIKTQSDRLPRNGRARVFVLGIASIVISLYFSFTAPNVVARWGGVAQLWVYGILVLSWLGAGWWWLKRGIPSAKWIFLGGIAFALLLLAAIFPHQIDFPPTADGGYPLPAPQIAVWQLLPLYLMLILSPVLLFAFAAYTDGVLTEQPSLGMLAGSFGVAGGYILVMVLSQVFTTVYDYIPVIGPFFRDKFWLVMLIPAVGAALPALLVSQKDGTELWFSKIKSYEWLGVSLVIILLAFMGYGLVSASPNSPDQPNETVRVFTYNIQQGYDEFGERNFDGQIQLIGTKAPDILGLQECDTARIAGGNADIVAYFADRLNMFSYYGPSPVTGTFGVALLSRYPIENPRTFYLFSLGEQVAVIEADITIADQTYKVYVTHLGNRGPIFQQEQLLALARGQNDVIMMGDFNFRHYEEQYALTITEYDDAYIHAAEQNIPAEFDLEERIDHVFVSPGMSIKVVEYLTEPESDHPALFVEIGK